MSIRVGLFLIAALAAPSRSSLAAQGPTPGSNGAVVVRKFATLRHDPARLLLFLRDMPKGGDLHSHLSGAVYAESLIRWAGEDDLCIITATLTLVAPPCNTDGSRPSASTIMGNTTLYGDVIDAWSLRNWNTVQRNGHDQFFESFGKFGLATKRRTGDMLAEVSSRAAADKVSYLELMQTLDGGASMSLGRQVGFGGGFPAMRMRIDVAGLHDSLVQALATLDADEARRNALLHCGTAAADAGCSVTIRYLYQVLRGRSRGEVFAQILAGFELASLDPRVVGFNLVQPEDDPVPMADFTVHMAMINFLRQFYPNVHITLHAGELAEGLVPPDGLRSHIRQSIEVGHAERIGHGVDVVHEDDADGLLRMMASRKIMVEIALSSNDGILGVRGNQHPLATYLRYGVPVALATDDQGVSRSDMTREYQRAVEDQGVDYPTLRMMARNSLVYAFVEPAEKARLLREFDVAIAKFEARWASAAP
jgi:hypothetical protein